MTPMLQVSPLSPERVCAISDSRTFMRPRDYHIPMRFLLMLVLLVPAFAQKPGDDAAVRDVVRRYVDARDHRDPKATESLFTADADQLVSSGEWRRGRDAVVKGTMASSEASGG